MPQFAPAGDGMMSRLVPLGLVFPALTLVNADMPYWDGKSITAIGKASFPYP